MTHADRHRRCHRPTLDAPSPPRDRIAVVLGDAQLAMLPRVRWARERQRHQTALPRWIGVPTADVSRIVLELELTPETRAVVKPHLAPTARGRVRFANPIREVISIEDIAFWSERMDLSRDESAILEASDRDLIDLEPIMNVARILVRAAPPGAMAVVERTLVEHAGALTATTDAAIAARRNAEVATAKWRAAQVEYATDVTRYEASLTAARTAMRAANQAAIDAAAARVEAIRAVRRALQDRLDRDDFAVIDRAARRASLPLYYDGPASPLPPIEQALTLDDLDDAQRESLEALRSRAESELDRIVRATLDASRASMEARARAEGHFAIEMRTGRLEFDRRELGGRVARTLQVTLTDAQADRVPSLQTLDASLRAHARDVE